jgi:type IV pilus assembly protein PilX
MNAHHSTFGPALGRQSGVSLVVALVMLIVLTLIGVSSMNTAIVELKMAGSAQQQSIALNRADELLNVGEQDVLAIVTDSNTFNWTTNGDGYYRTTDDINVYNLDWAAQGLDSLQGDNPTDTYVIEYLGAKSLDGESRVDGKGTPIVGAAIHTFRITARSTAAKNAMRLVQSIYVTTAEP